MAAGNFRPEDIEQARKCRQEILTLMSDSDDIGAQRKEVSHLNSKAEKAHNLERRQFKILRLGCAVNYQRKELQPHTAFYFVLKALDTKCVCIEMCINIRYLNNRGGHTGTCGCGLSFKDHFNTYAHASTLNSC